MLLWKEIPVDSWYILLLLLMTGESWLELGNLALAMNRRALTATDCESDEIPDYRGVYMERLGFDPNPLQDLALRGGRLGIVNCTRQWANRPWRRRRR